MEKEILAIICIFIEGIICYWYLTSDFFLIKNSTRAFEMEDVFIQEAANGELANRIAFIYSLSDLVIIKSLFQSEQIPFLCEFEYLSRVKNGLPITQINNVILNVLKKDNRDSIFLLKEYKKNKTNDHKMITKVRSIFEFIVISNAIPSSETCNIRILVDEEAKT